MSDNIPTHPFAKEMNFKAAISAPEHRSAPQKLRNKAIEQCVDSGLDLDK